VDGYASTIHKILAGSGHIKAIQLYTVARAPAEAWVSPLSDEAMRALALQLSIILSKLNSQDSLRASRPEHNRSSSIPISWYGAQGALGEYYADL